MAFRKRIDDTSDSEPLPRRVDGLRSYMAGHPRHRVAWTADAEGSNFPPAGASGSRAEDIADTPSLMDTFADAEQRIAQHLGDTADPSGHETVDAKRRLEILLWAQREANDIDDHRRRNDLERARRRDQDRRESATGWLRVGNRGLSFVLAIASLILLIGMLIELCVTGSLEPSQLIRPLP